MLREKIASFPAHAWTELVASIVESADVGADAAVTVPQGTVGGAHAGQRK